MRALHFHDVTVSMNWFALTRGQPILLRQAKPDRPIEMTLNPVISSIWVNTLRILTAFGGIVSLKEG